MEEKTSVCCIHVCKVTTINPCRYCSTSCNQDVTAVAADSVSGVFPPAQPAVHAASLSPPLTASSAAAAGVSSPPSRPDPAEAWSELPWPQSP